MLWEVSSQFPSSFDWFSVNLQAGFDVFEILAEVFES
jgi:hypothetical protein